MVYALLPKTHVLVLPILTGLLFFIFVACQKQDMYNEKIVRYLKDNSAPILSGSSENLSTILTEQVIAENEVFLASEYHAVAVNKDIRLSLIKTLFQHADTLCYFPELSFASAELLNEYLTTGDEFLLDTIYDHFKGTLEYTQENAQFWKILRTYTSQLPKEKKLLVVGCDIEHQSSNAFMYLHRLLRGKNPSTPITPLVDSLKSMYNISYNSSKQIQKLHLIIQNALSNKQEFKIMLGDLYFKFEHTLLNMQKATEYAVSNGDLDLREHTLFQNFKLLYSYVPHAKWFGQWGSYHTMPPAKHSNLAHLIKYETSSPSRNKLVTLHALYEDSYYMDVTNYHPISFSNVKKDNPYKISSDAPVVLYRLNTVQSPFIDKLLWWEHLKSAGGVTNDYYQYVLYIRNALASKPYS